LVTADLIILNGKVATVDKDFTFQEGIAVKNGWIIDVGTNGEMQKYIEAKTQVIDLNGKVILPAANDAHMHAVHTGFKLGPNCIDVGSPDIRSVKDIQEKIAEAIKKAPPGAWIYGMGWMGMTIKECAEEGRGLRKEDLDPVSPDNPVMLSDFGMHTLVVNSKALEIAGIDRSFRQLRPEEGIIERDPETGELTGCFGEWGAQTLITRHGPLLSDKEIEDCIIRAQKALNKYGITSHTDIVGIGGDNLILGSWGSRAINIYEKMHREGKLTARVSCNVFAAIDGIQSYDSIIEGLEKTELPEFKDRNWVKAETVKIFCDQGYWRREERLGFNNRSRSVFPGETDEEQAEEITKTILEVHRRGWQIGVHTIGGRSIDTVVKAYVKAQQEYPGKSPRHIIIHGDDMTMDNVTQMAKFNIICSPQPIAGRIVAGFMSQNVTVGEELFNWQEYINRGVVVAGGSDSTCFSLNWLEGVQFALTRTTIFGQAIRPDLAMKLEDAIRMYTINGAVQEHMEDIRGSIEVGKVADFQVLGEDIFTVPKEEIGKIPVIMTICDGKIVYEAEKA
jgi:predicted amidohydrolase YtcJ